MAFPHTQPSSNSSVLRLTKIHTPNPFGRPIIGTLRYEDRLQGRELVTKKSWGEVPRPRVSNKNLTNPRTAAPGHCLQIMASCKDARDLLLDSFEHDELSEDKFLLLNNLNTLKNSEFPYECYGNFYFHYPIVLAFDGMARPICRARENIKLDKGSLPAG